MRTLGPIGHLSADIRSILEIEEEEALLGVVKKKRRPRNDDKEKRQPAGGRFLLAPDFAVPGPFADRPMSASGHVSFHLARAIVTKGPGGSSILHAASGPKRLSSSAPADHDSYVARPEAVMTLTAADFEDYAGRESAVEILGDGHVALLTNISPDPAVRRDYWRKVHEHEREAQPDAFEFHRSRLSPSSWLQIAAIERLPSHVREMAAAMAATKGRKENKNKFDAEVEVEMDRGEARKLLSVIRDEVGGWDWKKSPIRLRKGRGGRTQFRLTAEFPIGIDAAARLRITSAFCRDLDEIGVMYTAAIHAPDHHNHEQNFHLHIAYHDRPANLMPDGRWDFEIREKVPGQWNRFRYPFRQPKIAALSRDPDGGNSKKYAASQMHLMRENYAQLCNRELKAVGCGRLFDPRTYVQMGIDQPPTQPLGPQSSALEAVGIPTPKGVENSEIIWTAELQRNIKTCNEARKTREAFRARVDDALRTLAGVDHPELSQRTEALAIRYDKHAQFLATYELDIGELGITLAMAHARPTKAADTCSRILQAIENGKASAADVKNRALIEERWRDAEMFLDGIDAIYEERKPIVEPLLDQRDAATKELAVITATLERLLTEELAAALLQMPSVETRQPAMIDRPIVLSDRQQIDELLDRIAKEDQPVLLPDALNDNFRVPEISREEYRLLNADQFSRWAQARLQGIAEKQHDRMKQAARLLSEHGQDGLDRMAATDSNARRALKHLAAYRDHPRMISLIAELTAEPVASPREAPVNSVHIAPAEVATAPNSSAELANPSVQRPDAGIVARAVDFLPEPDPAVVDVPNDVARPIVASSSMSQKKAVSDYAEFIRTDPEVRLIERNGEIRVDPESVPDWPMSAGVFADEQLVLDAVADRRAAENEKSESKIRARIIHELERCAFRPIERIRDRWVVRGIDIGLMGMAHQWQKHPELAAVYEHWDKIWTAKEMAAASRPVEQVPVTMRQDDSTLQIQVNRASEQDLGLSAEVQAAYLNSRTGRGR